MVNKLADVALRPRGRLAVRRSTGHIAPEHALTGVYRSREENIRKHPGGSTTQRQPDLEDLLMTDAVKVGFVRFRRPARNSRGFLRRYTAIRPRDREGAGCGGQFGQAGCRNQSIHGQKRVDARYFGAGGAQGQTPDRDGPRKVAEIKDNDFLKLGGSAAGKLRAGKTP